MIRSLEAHLLVRVLAALSLGAAILVLVSYFVTLDEMDEIFDENLKQVAVAVASHHPFHEAALPVTNPPKLPRLPRVFEEAGDFDFVTATWTRDGKNSSISDASVKLKFAEHNGLSRVTIGSEVWHRYTIVLDHGVVQAAQRATSRHTLAVAAASKLFLPLALLIGFIGLLIVAALRRGLRPLDRAVASVESRSEMSLEPIDVTGLPQEIHPIIRSINGLMHRLSTAFTAQRRFVADAAHELRSPVTALRLQVQLLERAADESAKSRAMAQLKDGIDRSQRLMEQLLSLSRVEPDAPSDISLIDLSELVRTSVGHRSIEAADREIDLGAEAHATVTVVGDSNQLLVLLDNLIGNALRYTPASGRVDVVSAEEAGRPVLRVLDSGPGIAVEERQRVFDRFYRGPGADSRQRSFGSGLGLAIVQAIAHRHRAEVSLCTAPSGRGLEVRVVFPRRAAE
jgi:two-component system OmpR family sensor kinase